MNLVEEAISVTLKTVSSSPDQWLNPKKGIKTKLVNKSKILRNKIKLKNDEEPIFEYSDKHVYSLITSQRVISYRDQHFYEKDLMDIFSVRPWFKIDSFEFNKPIKLLRVIDDFRNEFIIEFDSGTPTYFALMLILNLSSKKKKGNWFLNPGSHNG